MPHAVWHECTNHVPIDRLHATNLVFMNSENGRMREWEYQQVEMCENRIDEGVGFDVCGGLWTIKNRITGVPQTCQQLFTGYGLTSRVHPYAARTSFMPSCMHRPKHRVFPQNSHPPNNSCKILAKILTGWSKVGGRIYCSSPEKTRMPKMAVTLKIILGTSPLEYMHNYISYR